jgi:hypothetical protein
VLIEKIASYPWVERGGIKLLAKAVYLFEVVLALPLPPTSEPRSLKVCACPVQI